MPISRLSVFLALASFVAGVRQVRAQPISAEETEEAYKVYSSILSLREAGIKNWKIGRESIQYKHCNEGAKNTQAPYKELMEAYAARNQGRITFEHKFDLPSYELVDRKDLKRRDSDEKTALAEFSRVGFNESRTRATLCAWIKTSGTCYVRIKEGGVWQLDRDYRGEYHCAWAA